MLINVSNDIVRGLIEMNTDFSAEAIDYLLDYYADVCGDGSGFSFDPTKIDSEWTEYETSDIIIEFGYLVEDEETEDYTIEDVLEELENVTTVYRLENHHYLVCDW